MEACIDFVNCLDADVSARILMCLDDISDIARVSAVSHSWRRFVIASGLCKHLCLKMHPQLSMVTRVMELPGDLTDPMEVGTSSFMELGASEMDHRIHLLLARACTSFPVGKCIYEAVSASSTDNYPEEGVQNTLERRTRIPRRVSYWSSKGQSNPAVPETLVYKLVSNLCVITEISIQPFQAYFQFGLPIYSAKSVRFRIGHPKFSLDAENSLMASPCGEPMDDKFIWTYTSQEFPMAQENSLQKFTLPEPVLCIGGFIQIELLGRVQRQEMDELFYICLSYVQVYGRSLPPVFDVEIPNVPNGEFLLKHLPRAPPPPQPRLSDDLERRVRDLEQILNLLRDNVVDAEEYEWIEEDDDSDEELLL